MCKRVAVRANVSRYICRHLHCPVCAPVSVVCIASRDYAMLVLAPYVHIHTAMTRHQNTQSLRLATKMTPEKAKRILAAIAEGLADAPESVLEQAGPALEEIADEWGLSEIVERCHLCWRTWDECNDGDGAPACGSVGDE